MIAEWILDYDHITDKCFCRPGCPECDAPVMISDDGKYRCISCGEQYEVDPEMQKWIADRSGTKTEMTNCTGCGGENCVETHYVKNKVSLEWQTAWGVCRNCGSRFIV